MHPGDEPQLHPGRALSVDRDRGLLGVAAFVGVLFSLARITAPAWLPVTLVASFVAGLATWLPWAAAAEGLALLRAIRDRLDDAP